MSERIGDWFQTYTSVQFWPLDPRSEDVNIEDIAHALALQCRFNGACKEFYSIAQHSVMVSRIVPPEHVRWGLLHDAAEAYIGDMVRPLKKWMADFRDIEARIMRCICERFGLSIEEPPCVKEADNVMLMTERRDLMGEPPAPWTSRAKPLPKRLIAVDSYTSETNFLACFKDMFPEPSWLD